MFVRDSKSYENTMLKVKCGFVNILESDFQILKFSNSRKDSRNFKANTYENILIFVTLNSVCSWNS